MSSTIQYRRSVSNGNTHPTKMVSLNRASLARPVSNATSIDASSDVEDSRRKPAPGWATRKENILMQTMVEEEKEDVSDAESFDSLSSRAKFMSDLLSDSDSSIDGRTSLDGDVTQTSLSSYSGPATPRTPADGCADMVEIVDDKSPRIRAMSMEASPSFAAKIKEMTTVGPRGPHLFRSYSTSHSTATKRISVSTANGALPLAPSASDASRSPRTPLSRNKMAVAGQLTLPGDSEPIVLGSPKSRHPSISSEYDIDEVRSWMPNQVCAWMIALGFDEDMVQKFQKNDITGGILIDLKWDDLKELDIQSFGKRIELWTEIHHLRARTSTSQKNAGSEFVRSSSRVTHSPSTSSRMRSDSQGSTVSAKMTVREAGSFNEYEVRALPTLPALLPRKEKAAKQETISEADEEASDEATRVRNRPQLRKKRRTNVRMPRRQVSVDSIIITSEDGGDSYVAKLEALTSFDESRRARRTRSRVGIAPEDSVSLRGSRKPKCKKHHRHHGSEDSQKSQKPHRCSKGERCAKHGKKTQRTSQQSNGTIVIATTPSVIDISAIPRPSALMSDGPPTPRPQSVVAPSVLASSDVLGPIEGKEIKLKESALREISRMDPLENVKQFLTHQHLQHLQERRDSPPPVPTKSAEDIARAQRSTPSPPPMAGQMYGLHNGSQTKLNSLPPPHCPPTPSPPLRIQTPSSGLRIQGMERAAPPHLNFSNPSRIKSPHMMRTTTPFSEADVPCPTSTPFNPRDQSQSVPPDLHYRRLQTPSLESLISPIVPKTCARPQKLHMTAVDENAEWEAVDEEVKIAPSPSTRTHSGWMKKRRTNWFRHEWPDYHFVLKGTHLGYAKDVATGDVGCIDMDNYQVACTNTGSTKLSAAFKAGRIFGRKKEDSTAGSYFFQLVPANELCKGKKSLGKVHYFAVESREERIDWMRELMLAKAIKQKGQGFKVEVNGERV